MNSLHNISGYLRKAVIASILVSLLGIVVAGQDVRQQGKMYGDAGFVGEPINLKIVNMDIRELLSYITEQYGINFVIDKSVKAVPVTVNVNDVPWNVALDSVLRSQELGVQVNGTILRVADSKTLATEGEIRRLQMDNQLDSSPLYTEFMRLNYARAVGNIGRGSATSGTQSGSGGGMGSSMSSGAGVGNEGLLPIVKRRLSRRGSVEVDLRSNSLIITDVRENIDAIRQLIEILDQPEPQVEIEARIVVATRNFSRDVGVQISALVIGARGSGAGGGTLPEAPVDPRLPIPPSLPVGSINNNLASQIANTAIGLTTGVFGTAQINMLITAGEQKGQAKVIATPRVTALNNRQAVIESKTQIPITTIQPGSAAGGAVIATTEYIDVPLKLEITPQITDLGTIVLDVVAENSSTATLVSGAAPAINTQTMQTQVTVPDGGTTVVGGVLFDDERENQDRTPGLSRIPILGALFKRKGVQRNTNEILFFITPRIYRPDYETKKGSSGTRPNATIIQPVPLGNPVSNSGSSESAPVPVPSPMPVIQPVVQQPAPEKP
ncbi:MAG TPA: type IV pilus secretin PilQ [Pyrinomonadaceae bacterium]|nr:type IV pilus secretin PilQ [Chloracidobacterium sp.]HRJ87807.1 type IV pilus secretin PilQ [Pyrinomonadaceae bacterium]HRK50263.1 type IV pilus secretin PilQ [Pyrinomonadaceae bacterium]